MLTFLPFSYKKEKKREGEADGERGIGTARVSLATSCCLGASLGVQLAFTIGVH